MTNPTQGAMRAAKAIVTCRVPLVFEQGAAALNKSVGDRARAANLYAAIIDRETHGPLMLEALKRATALIQAEVCAHKGLCSLDNPECYAGEQLVAIHAAENGE